MIVEKRANLQPNKRYDLFFIAGTYVLVPELLHPSVRSITSSAVRMGLALDDCWDFGINRHVYSGQFVSPLRLPQIIDPYLGNVFEEAKAKTLQKINNSKDSEFREKQTVNLDRFEAGIMRVEALGLAIPFKASQWSEDLIDKYRATGTLVWGALFAGLRPKSQLLLPEIPAEPLSGTHNPADSLVDFHSSYYRELLSSGSGGKEAIALANEMMFVQIQMDWFDQHINRAYGSPAFSVFPERFENQIQRGKDYLQSAQVLSSRRITPSRILAGLFPLMYRLCADSMDWRDIRGWKNIRQPTTPQV